MLLAYLAIPAVQSLGAGSIPRVADVAIDRTVLSFVLAASLLTGVILGLEPALQLSRTGAASVLKEGGHSSTGAGGRWLRSTLLVGEVALSLMLLVGAALLLRSFANLTRVDPGFDAEGVLAFQVSLPAVTYPGLGPGPAVLRQAPLRPRRGSVGDIGGRRADAAHAWQLQPLGHDPGRQPAPRPGENEREFHERTPQSLESRNIA